MVEFLSAGGRPPSSQAVRSKAQHQVAVAAYFFFGCGCCCCCAGCCGGVAGLGKRRRSMPVAWSNASEANCVSSSAYSERPLSRALSAKANSRVAQSRNWSASDMGYRMPTSHPHEKVATAAVDLASLAWSRVTRTAWRRWQRCPAQSDYISSALAVGEWPPPVPSILPPSRVEGRESPGPSLPSPCLGNARRNVCNPCACRSWELSLSALARFNSAANLSRLGGVSLCKFDDPAKAWPPQVRAQCHFRTASIHGGELTRWVKRVVSRSARNVRFTPDSYRTTTPH